MDKSIEDVINDLVFAYVNKDDDLPHVFELDALKQARELLVNKDYLSFIDSVIEDVEDKMY